MSDKDDCISRQAAIDAMTNTLWHYPNECYRNLNEYEFAKGLVEFGLKSVPPAQPETYWIPCSERLPYAEYGESDNVLATCGYRGVEDGSIRWIKTLYFNGGNWCYPTGETYLEKVYAWMPLPNPYKGGDSD